MTKRIMIAAMTALFLLPSFAPANGLNLNGLGSRAQGMGGAFVSIANDFSAVFWNPAGAAGFRQTTFGFCAADTIPRTTFLQHQEASAVPLVDARTKTSHYLGFLAGYYRPVSSKVVLGIGISTPTAQGTMWNGADFAGVSNGVAYDRSSRGYAFSFSPMVAVKLSEAISFGAAVNIDHGTFTLKTPYGMSTWPTTLLVFWIDPNLGAPVDLGQYEENMNGWGFGATLGLLVKPFEKLSVGLTVRTPSTVFFKGAANLSNLSLYGFPASSDLKRQIAWPLRIAGGLSFRPFERVLLSADVNWTRWSKLDRITTEYLDPAWIALMEFDGTNVRALDWKDALQIRFGAEYLLDPSTSLRAGYYHDPAPGPDSTLDVLLPTFTNNVFSVGVGKTLGGLQLDFGLEFMAGNKRQLSSLLFAPRDFGMHAFVPTASVSYKF
ncbi:MAG: OmpP1/FadL family transporter [Candidatus Aminicenantes bacterium RBG_16_66_30]